MAYGDAIMATSLARGMHAQGKLAAFGDPITKTLKWTGYCENVFKHNPNILHPEGNGRQSNVVWFRHYKKNLMFLLKGINGQRRYFWNYQFKAIPGEFFFTPREILGLPDKTPYIMIEPNVALYRGPVNINKDWGDDRYEKVAKALREHGHTVVQCVHENSTRIIPNIHHIVTPTFRDAMRVMAKARLIIAPEGANHHASAALKIPAVIVWGDWSPPKVVGYNSQIYLRGGGTEACGNWDPCSHCRATFDRITVDEVYEAAIGVINGYAAART
jgi:ADP-heptose:LPS heptosyltransferase